MPKGHRLVCIASEPMVEEPAAMAFDGNGAPYACKWQAFSQNDLPPASAWRAIPMTARFFTTTTRGFNHCRSTPANQ